MTVTDIIIAFKSYNWGELYSVVKDEKYTKDLPAEKQYTVAIKAMLLASWWSDNIYSKEILSNFPRIITEPLTHFAVAYAYMSLGHKKEFEWYMSKLPRKYPKWMKNYLQLEYFGRSLKDKQQINLVRKLTPKNQYPADYIKVALLQSLEHDKADTSYLEDFIQDINLMEDKENPLSKALLLRVNKIKIDANEDYSFPILQSLKMRSLIKNNYVVEALLSGDALAKDKSLDINTIQLWLGISISIPQGRDYLAQRIEFAINLVPNSIFIQGTIASYALINAYIKGDYKTAYNVVKQFNAYTQLPQTNHTRNAQIFFGYVFFLCVNWQKNQQLYSKKINAKKLIVLGESHSLSLSNININIAGEDYIVKSNFILGVKMHYLATPSISFHAKCLVENINALEENSDVMFTIGEIDTRPDGGIWKAHTKKGIELDKVIKDTIHGYIDFLYDNLKDKKLKTVTIQGIPAPNYKLIGDKDPIDKEGFLNMIKTVNETLKKYTLEKDWRFLDVYNATLGEDGKSNKKWHIDAYHLKPQFYLGVNEWLINTKI